MAFGFSRGLRRRQFVVAAAAILHILKFNVAANSQYIAVIGA